MEKYQNKYRIPSARATWWDYSWSAAYFITICTKNRTSYFGEIQNGIMCLNEIGSLLIKEWEKTPVIRADMNLSLGEFVVMPNHFHAIVVIGDNEYNMDGVRGGGTCGVRWACGTRGVRGARRDALQCVSTFGPQRKNLASIVRGTKSVITTQARKINPDFGWQARYHDHIIRDQRAFENISKYIINNPAKWKEDRFY